MLFYTMWHATWCLCVRINGWERRQCLLLSWLLLIMLLLPLLLLLLLLL